MYEISSRQSVNISKRKIAITTIVILLALILAACQGEKVLSSQVEDAVISSETIQEPIETPAEIGTSTVEAALASTTLIPTETETPGGNTADIQGDGRPGSAGLGDPFYPDMGNGGYDVLHYTIDLDIDIDQGAISGTTTIDASASQDLSAFNLDFFGLELTRVLVDGESADWIRAGSELTITPTQSISEGSSFSAEMAYHGVPRTIDDPGVPFLPLGWQPQQDGFFAVSEPSGSMNWYPVNNHPTDKATYSFEITTPDPYMAVANGLLTETIEEEGKTTYIWQAKDPMSSYLATVHVGRYEVESEEGPNGIPIRNYFYEGTPDEVKSDFDGIAEMMEFMNELIAPYPFEAYGVVLLDHPTSWALETQTLSTFGQSFTDEEVVFHELMHQWFGDSVSPATWQDVWMNEGFASYFTQLWGEHKNGGEWLERNMDQLYDAIAERDLPPPVPTEVGQMFSSSSYSRGAWTLHALRETVGDELFFDILKLFYQRYQYSTASTQDFIDVAVELGGAEAGNVLCAWLYSDEVPPRP